LNQSSESSQLIFWGSGTARTLRPIWVAEELTISYQLMPIGPRTGETKTPEYTELNPKQKVPFCVDGELKLSESLAICRYLVNKYGSANSLQAPNSIEQQAKEDEWLCFIFGELDETSLYVMRRHGALSNIYGEAPAAMEAASEYVIRQLKVIDKHMLGREYVLNNRFSLPDVFLTTCLNWVEAYDIPMSAELTEYRDKMTQRDAYKKAAKINKPD
jgi:glutathione S-transferase